MLSTTQLILISGVVIVLILIFFSMKKEKFVPNADFATLNNIKVAKNNPMPILKYNMYEPTYTSKIMYGGKVLACPPNTINVGDKCLTSRFGPLVNGKCPRNMLPNESNDDNMKCKARFSPRKLINGVLRCYESEIDTEDMKCAAGNDTVFTKREFLNGKWVCPPGTADTGFTYDDGPNGIRQCIILP